MLSGGSATSSRRLVPAPVRWLLAALVVVCASVPRLEVSHAAVILTDVTVRVYDNTDLPDAVRRTALAHAAEIFARAEVEVGWVHCPARCGRTPGPDQLILRMTKSPATAVGVGSSLIDPVLQAGRLATVYVDQVDGMARRSSVGRVEILGRAVAHEVAHLLLGSAEHTRTGLMREVWTTEELRRNRPEDWQFAPVQRTLMRARLAAGVPFRWTVAAPRAPGKGSGS